MADSKRDIRRDIINSYLNSRKDRDYSNSQSMTHKIVPLKVLDRTEIEERLAFINSFNINYCLSYFDEHNNEKYLASYPIKKDKLILNLSKLNSQRKLFTTIAELKRIAGQKKMQSNLSSWINFSNRLQINWISAYLQQRNEFDIFERLVENEINKDNKFFICSTVAFNNNIHISDLLADLRSEWGHIYNSEDLDWIEKKNKKQLKWIYSYINNIDLSRCIDLEPPTNELEKFEYIYIVLSLFINFPDLRSVEQSGDGKRQTPKEFIRRLKKSWQVYDRRTLKKEEPIYKTLPVSIRSRLKELSKENNCTAEEMIEFMIDTYQDAP